MIPVLAEHRQRIYRSLPQLLLPHLNPMGEQGRTLAGMDAQQRGLLQAMNKVRRIER